MKGLLKASPVRRHVSHATDLTLKDCIRLPCSVEGRSVVALTADKALTRKTKMLVSFDLKKSRTQGPADLQRGNVIPIFRVGQESFPSIVAIRDSN